MLPACSPTKALVVACSVMRMLRRVTVAIATMASIAGVALGSTSLHAKVVAAVDSEPCDEQGPGFAPD